MQAGDTAARRNRKVLSSGAIGKKLERISLLSAALPGSREEAEEIVHEGACMMQGPNLTSEETVNIRAAVTG